jgi:hypothetical protein
VKHRLVTGALLWGCSSGDIKNLGLFVAERDND